MRSIEPRASDLRRLRRLRGVANWTLLIYVPALVLISFLSRYVHVPEQYVGLGGVTLILVSIVPVATWGVVRLRFWLGYVKCPECGAPFEDMRKPGGFIPAECWLCHYNVVVGGATSNNALERTRHG
jgi:hypothetical protein